MISLLRYRWNRFKALLAQSDFGWCLRCGRTWQHCERHETWLGKKIPQTGVFGIFPLCEECWMELGRPEARLPYYRKLFKMWKGSGEQWAVIERAVMEGK